MRQIESQRLVLRPHAPADDPQLHRILMEAEVMERVFGGGARTSPEECDRFIDDHFSRDAGPIGIGTLSLRSNAAVIGFAGLIPCDADGYANDVELGVALGTRYQGEGYATEISRAMIDFALGELGYPRVLALTHPDNHGGRAVLDRLGFQFIEETSAGERAIRRVYAHTRVD